MDKQSLEQDTIDGLSLKDIALKYNKSVGSVRYWLGKLHLKTIYAQFGKPGARKSPPPRSNSTDWQEIQSVYDKGASTRDIIKQFLISQTRLDEATRSGKFKPRSLSVATALAHKMGKYDYSSYRTAEFRDNASKFGGLKNNSGRCKTYYYESIENGIVPLLGTWEVAYVKYLDGSGIKWHKNHTVSFPYVFNGEQCKYYPDFFLPESGRYVEVKGFKTDRDKAKWDQSPFELLIVDRKYLELHQITIESIHSLEPLRAFPNHIS